MTKKVIRTIIIVTLLVLLQQIYNYHYCPIIRETKLCEAIKFAENNNMNERYFMFVDFSEHSGRSRFCLYDNKNKTVVLKGLCAHGCGKGSTLSKPEFSNIPNSNCSSIGRYKIKHFIRTKHIRKAYVLSGLDISNSNAEKRGILIHPSKTVSMFGFGCFPFYIPLGNISRGCFAISINNFNNLAKIISHENKPILLTAYADN